MRSAASVRALESRLLTAQIAAMERLDAADLWLLTEGKDRIFRGGPMTPEERAALQRWQGLVAAALQWTPAQRAAQERLHEKLRQHYVDRRRAEMRAAAKRAVATYAPRPVTEPPPPPEPEAPATATPPFIDEREGPGLRKLRAAARRQRAEMAAAARNRRR